MHVYIVENNWGDGNSIDVFSTKKSAVKNFKDQVKEQLDPELSDAYMCEVAKRAVVAGRFEYSGNGDAHNNPYIAITRERVQK